MHAIAGMTFENIKLCKKKISHKNYIVYDSIYSKFLEIILSREKRD